MTIKVNQSGLTLNKIAEDLELEGGANYLRIYHNLHGDSSETITSNEEEVAVGTVIFVPEEPIYREEPTEESLLEKESEEQSIAFADYDKDKEEPQQKSESRSSEHEGKYFVIQKGKCQCDKGFKFPSFKVTSHNKHYWNDENGKSDFLAVTEEDVTLEPSAQPFGKCKLRPSGGGYLSCVYSPAGKWQKTYDKTKVMGKSCVTEISELMCATGGKITVKNHGQVSELGKKNVQAANAMEQQLINPLVDFEEFLEKVEKNNENHYN